MSHELRLPGVYDTRESQESRLLGAHDTRVSQELRLPGACDTSESQESRLLGAWDTSESISNENKSDKVFMDTYIYADICRQETLDMQTKNQICRQETKIQSMQTRNSIFLVI